MEDLNILAGEIIPTKERKLKDVVGSYTYFADNDVLLAKITPCFENGKIGIACNLKNGIGFGSSEYIVFRSIGKVKPEYLYYFLSRKKFRQEGEARMSGAVGHKRVSKEFIEDYMIPFPRTTQGQMALVKMFNSVAERAKRLELFYSQKLEGLDELKKSILHKAFAGKLTYSTEKIAT
jgi:type I restriction enzyme S subunit